MTSTVPVELVALIGLRKSSRHAAQVIMLEAKLDIKRMALQAHLLTKSSQKPPQPQPGLASGMQGRFLRRANPVGSKAVATAPWLIPAARCREL